MIKKLFKIAPCILLAWIIIEWSLLPRGDEYLTTNPVETKVMELRSDQANSSFSLRYTYVPISKISPHLRRAVVVAEDSRFYEHHGFDWEAIIEAVQEAWKKKKFPRGASTLTQQLAKNLYFSLSKDPVRKIREAITTMKLERHLGKNRILELYMNVAEWGEGVFGAEAASKYYFGKPASALSKQEAALLAAMLPSPRGIFNYKKHPGRVQSRAAIILARM